MVARQTAGQLLLAIPASRRRRMNAQPDSPASAAAAAAAVGARLHYSTPHTGAVTADARPPGRRLLDFSTDVITHLLDAFGSPSSPAVLKSVKFVH